MPSGPWAHSPSPNSTGWHSLEDHSRGTAALAERFADQFGAGRMGYWLGLLHDVGKAGCAWQRRLVQVAASGERVGLDHKALGTRMAKDRLGGFALAVWGHHGGLIDRGRLPALLRTRLDEHTGEASTAEAVVLRILPELGSDERIVAPSWAADPVDAELGLRLLYSALCDADSLDTAAHVHALPAPSVRTASDFALLRDHFEAARRASLARRARSPIDEIRADIYDHAIRVAVAHPPGIFRLAAPTGAGKTLTTAGFALHHAAAHGLRRVVVAVPFLTITEQNAQVYRELLDGAENEPVVLEHHSGVDFDQRGPQGGWARLAAENWDAPFVVTTFVRLFESIFGRRRSALRRLHRLAGSVIVLDEVQALRHAMLVPILHALRGLVEQFGVTVLLSSATQPSLWSLEPFQQFRLTDGRGEPVDLVADPVELARTLRRVEFDWRLAPAPTLADVADEAMREGCALVVVNTTRDARSVYERWHEGADPATAWHLSTRMCPVHRRRVIQTVRDRLAAGLPVLLVSTQLIEAGVDVDFPVVFRAFAPADSLLQAAGRANREGRLQTPGRVVVFEPQDGSAPSEYKHLVGQTRLFFGPGKSDPDDLAQLDRYYRSVYTGLNLADPASRGMRIHQARGRWDFETVADGPLVAGSSDQPGRDARLAFRLIDDDGVAVVCADGANSQVERDDISALISRVRAGTHPMRVDLRRLQHFTVTLHPSAVTPAVIALMRPIIGTEVRTGALVEWRGDYDPQTGIDLDPATERFIL